VLVTATPTSVAFRWDAPTAVLLTGPYARNLFWAVELSAGERVETRLLPLALCETTLHALEGPSTEYMLRLRAELRQTSAGAPAMSSAWVAIPRFTTADVAGVPVTPPKPVVHRISSEQVEVTILAAPCLNTEGQYHCSSAYNLEQYEGKIAEEGPQEWLSAPQITCLCDHPRAPEIVSSLERRRVALKPYSEYHFRVQAVNRHGVSDWSEVTTILPTPAAPDVRVENVKSQMVTLVWNVPEDYGHEVQHYHVFHQQADEEGSSKEAVVSASRDKTDESGDTEVRYHAQQLQPNGTYVFYVQASSEGGLSDPSGSLRVTTLPMAPPIPTMVTVDDIQTHSVRISWAIEADTTNRASACEVSWRVVLDENEQMSAEGAGKPAWSTEQDESEEWTTKVVPAAAEGQESDFAFQLQSLEADTLYAIQVRGVNEGGDGPWSPAVTQRTQVRRPKIPSSLRDDEVTSSSVSLSWDVAEDAEYPVTAYQLRCVRVGESALDTPWVTVPPPDVQDKRMLKMVEDLEPGAEYAFSLRALNYVGPGKPTPPLLITMLCEAPPPPAQPTFQDQTPCSITLDWCAPEPDNGAKVDAYCLQRRKNESDVWETVVKETDKTHIRVHCDQPNTYYHFRVKARNRMGWSEWSDAIMVATLPPPAPEAPTGITVVVTHESVTLKWLHHRGSISAYEVQQRQGGAWTSLVEGSNAVANQIALWERKRTSRGEQLSRFPIAFTKDSLRPGTEYLFRIAAKNEGGRTFSEPVRVTTEDDAWGRGLSDEECRQLKQLCVQCQCAAAYEPLLQSLHDVDSLGALPRAELAEVLGRLPLTPREQDRLRRSLVAPPSAPPRPFRTSATADSLCVAWDPPPDAAAAVFPVVGYLVQYRLHDTSDQHAARSAAWAELQCGGESCRLRDLSQDQAYAVRVAACNEARGAGSFSDAAVLRTHPAVCEDLALRELVHAALASSEYAERVAVRLYHEQWTPALLRGRGREELERHLRDLQVHSPRVACGAIIRVAPPPAACVRG